MALSDHLTDLDDLARRRPDARRIVAALRALIARGQAVSEALARYERKRTRSLEIARQTIVQLAADLGAFVDQYFTDLDLPPQLFVDGRAAQAELYRLLAYRRGFAGASGLQAGATDDGLAGLDARRLIPYRVRQGDTLERVALRTLGDETRWTEIVELNGLLYPFLRSEGPLREPDYKGSDYAAAGYVTSPSANAAESTVRTTGQQLWLPPDAQVPEAEATFTDLDLELYGRDFMLQEGRLSTTIEGRLRTVQGRDNIKQALLQRIGTGRGELVLHPTYGIDRMLAVGVEGTRANVEVAGLEVARTIAQDPRVTFVRDVAIHFVDTANKASMGVGLIGPAQRDLALNLVLPDVVSVGGGNG